MMRAGLAMVLAAGALAGCTTGTTMPSATRTTTTMPAVAPWSAMDVDAATHVLQDSAAEVQIAQLARTQSGSDRVRQFAEVLIRDHTQAQAELSGVAQGQLRAPLPLVPKHVAMMNELAARSGHSFDVAFLEHMIADHAKSIAMHERIAATATDPGLRAWAARQLPTLRSHYAAVNDLHVALGRAPATVLPSASPPLRVR